MTDLADDDPRLRLAVALRKGRDHRGMRQVDLATAAQVSLRTLIRVESGEDVRVSTLEAIAKGLGFTVAQLLAAAERVTPAEVEELRAEIAERAS